jgi:hypothetical protein
VSEAVLWSGMLRDDCCLVLRDRWHDMTAIGYRRMWRCSRGLYSFMLLVVQNSGRYAFDVEPNISFVGSEPVSTARQISG